MCPSAQARSLLAVGAEVQMRLGSSDNVCRHVWERKPLEAEGDMGIWHGDMVPERD